MLGDRSWPQSAHRRRGPPLLETEGRSATQTCHSAAHAERPLWTLGALGLAYSIYPYVVMNRLTVWQAASSAEALEVILVDAAVAVPAIAGYTVFAYRVFRGKASALTYG